MLKNNILKYILDYQETLYKEYEEYIEILINIYSISPNVKKDYELHKSMYRTYHAEESSNEIIETNFSNDTKYNDKEIFYLFYCHICTEHSRDILIKDLDKVNHKYVDCILKKKKDLRLYDKIQSHLNYLKLFILNLDFVQDNNIKKEFDRDCLYDLNSLSYTSYFLDKPFNEQVFILFIEIIETLLINPFRHNEDIYMFKIPDILNMAYCCLNHNNFDFLEHCFDKTKHIKNINYMEKLQQERTVLGSRDYISNFDKSLIDLFKVKICENMNISIETLNFLVYDTRKFIRVLNNIMESKGEVRFNNIYELNLNIREYADSVVDNNKQYLIEDRGLFYYDYFIKSLFMSDFIFLFNDIFSLRNIPRGFHIDYTRDYYCIKRDKKYFVADKELCSELATIISVEEKLNEFNLYR